MTLTLTPNLSDADAFYDALTKSHEVLNDDESAAFNARLILILANQIGDNATLQAALQAARDPDSGN